MDVWRTRIDTAQLCQSQCAWFDFIDLWCSSLALVSLPRRTCGTHHTPSLYTIWWLQGNGFSRLGQYKSSACTCAASRMGAGRVQFTISQGISIHLSNSPNHAHLGCFRACSNQLNKATYSYCTATSVHSATHGILSQFVASTWCCRCHALVTWSTWIIIRGRTHAMSFNTMAIRGS